MHPVDSTSLSHPTGVKLVIAYLLLSIGVGLGNFCLVLLLGIPPGIAYFNLLFSTIFAIEIVGLWRMTRWGFWLAIAMGAVGLVAGSYNLARLIGNFQSIMGSPFFWNILGLFFLTYGGPAQLIGSTLTIAYMYNRLKLSRSSQSIRESEEVRLTHA
jgi:hypothetical protein